MAKRVGRGRNRLRDLKADLGLPAQHGTGQAVDPSPSLLVVHDLPVTRIELPWLPIDVGLGEVGKEEVHFGREPGAVPARIVPLIAAVERRRRSRCLQGGMGPKKVLVACRPKEPQHSAAIGQEEHFRPVGESLEFRRLANSIQRLEQAVFHGLYTRDVTGSESSLRFVTEIGNERHQ